MEWNDAGMNEKENELFGESIEGYRLVAELMLHSANRSFLGERRFPNAPYGRAVIKLWYAADHKLQQEPLRILQELFRLQRLSHPHILPMMSVGTHKGVPYSITEYVASGSLYDYLQRRSSRKPLPEEQALSLLAQIGQALHYAHQRQIVHGRLKPHNVLLKSASQALVADFRLPTLALPDKTYIMNPWDLSVYLAPEQFLGYTNPKSDQYALACLAYELLTGTKVFMIPSVKTPGKYYRTRSLITPRHLNMALPVYIEEAILKALSRDPAQRFENIAAFLTALGLSATTATLKVEHTGLPASELAIPTSLVHVYDDDIARISRNGSEAQLIKQGQGAFPFLGIMQGFPVIKQGQSTFSLLAVKEGLLRMRRLIAAIL
jgi:serine/threonine protein kinase